MRAIRAIKQFETLENRRLLAMTVVNGVLNVTGTNGPDTITVSAGRSALTVQQNGVSRSVPLAGLGAVSIEAMGGDDTVTLNSSLMLPATLNGGSGNDRLTGS